MSARWWQRSPNRHLSGPYGPGQQLQLDPSSCDAPSIVSSVGPVSAMRGMRAVLAEIVRAIRSSALALATLRSRRHPPSVPRFCYVASTTDRLSIADRPDRRPTDC